MKNYAWHLGCCYMTQWSRNSEGTVAVMPLKWQASRVTDRQTDGHIVTCHSTTKEPYQ